MFRLSFAAEDRVAGLEEMRSGCDAAYAQMIDQQTSQPMTHQKGTVSRAERSTSTIVVAS